MDGNFEGSRIAVIEDEEDLVKILKRLLEDEGFKALIALDGRSGLELVRKEKPDLVVLDIMLPGLDGRDVLVHIKKDDATKDIPVIMLTAKAEQFERDYALSLKADAYIDKPYEPEALMREIRNQLRKAREH